MYSITTGGTWYIVDDTNLLIKKDKKPTGNTYGKYKKLKRQETILGYKCSIYKQKRHTPFGDDIMLYSVADSLKIDNTCGYSWAINNNLTLKSVQKTENGTFIIKATQIKSKPLNDSIFKLPNYPIIEVDFENLSKKAVKEANEQFKDD